VIDQGNFYDKFTSGLQTVEGNEGLDRVTLVHSDSGDVLAQYDRVDGTWTRTR
jgi:hypothetical protein